jgi:hypothetical protein
VPATVAERRPFTRRMRKSSSASSNPGGFNRHIHAIHDQMEVSTKFEERAVDDQDSEPT